MNIELRKTIINDCLENGKIGTIVFTKKSTGEERTMNCRFKHLSESERKTTTRKSNPDIITVWDIPNHAYKAIRLDSIKSISARTEKINFEGKK